MSIPPSSLSSSEEEEEEEEEPSSLLLSSRSLPNLTLLTSSLSLSLSDLDELPSEPPTSPHSSFHSRSRTPSPIDLRSTLTPKNVRRTTEELINHHHATSLERERDGLPSDLLRVLETPRATGNGRVNDDYMSGQRDHQRSPEPLELELEESHEALLRRRFESLERDRGGSSSAWSIHSAPAEFDVEERERVRARSESPVMEMESPSPGTPMSIGAGGGRRAASSGEGLEAKGFVRLPFSLFEYLQEEVLAVEHDGEEGVKSERVTNFLSVPAEVEKIVLFGCLICLDSFLYTFTILPLRVLSALYNLFHNLFYNLFLRQKTGRKRHLRLSHKCDLAKAVIAIGTVAVLHRVTDASKMYHSVRGQETIKLYVIFNVLEIADRLCCSFGQDLQDSLFSRQAFGRRTDGSHPHIRPFALIALNLGYVVAHTLVLFYQLVTLNVAINSYSNALLTLLLSNQFVEIKGSVFKKFEKENLFQITCADIVERFQLSLLLFIIALRNLIELSSSSPSPSFSIFSLSLPSPSFSLLQTIFSPAITVLISECFVDWLKHAFITKFNHIRPQVYGRFIDVLCKDLVGAGTLGLGGGAQPFVDQSPSVSRRLGFAALPLGCLVVRVIFQALEMLSDESGVDECAPRSGSGGLGEGGGGGGIGLDGVAGWLVLCLGVGVGWACLVAFKLLIGINLRIYATTRWSQMASRLSEDRLNDRSRKPIGVTEKEVVLERENARLWDNTDLDAVGKKTGMVGLGELSRYDMVKSRVW